MAATAKETVTALADDEEEVEDEDPPEDADPVVELEVVEDEEVLVKSGQSVWTKV